MQANTRSWAASARRRTARHGARLPQGGGPARARRQFDPPRARWWPWPPPPSNTMDRRTVNRRIRLPSAEAKSCPAPGPQDPSWPGHAARCGDPGALGQATSEREGLVDDCTLVQDAGDVSGPRGMSGSAPWDGRPGWRLNGFPSGVDGEEIALRRPSGYLRSRSDRRGCRGRRAPALWEDRRPTERGRSGRTGQRWPTRWPGGVSMRIASLPVGPDTCRSDAACARRSEFAPPRRWTMRQICRASALAPRAVGPKIRPSFGP